MKPYYSDDSVTLYHGDCYDLLDSMPDFDLLLTDPPYGIASVWKGGASCGWSNARAETEARNEWDATTPDLTPILAKASDAIVWGGNYFPLPLSRGWLIWNKPERGFTLSEAELAWTSRDMPMRVKDCNRSDTGREHPTQKPLFLMRWCLDFFPKAQTVFDPFCGSGTTLRAAKDMGRKVVGIEREEKWCEVAAKRCAQEVLL